MFKKPPAPKTVTTATDADADLKKWTSQIRKGTLEMSLLGVIASSPRYGFEIVQSLNETGGLSISEGTIYPLLNRLQNEGLIEAYWQESPTGPPRKYYTLTPLGQQVFQRMRAEWRLYAKAVETVLRTSDACTFPDPVT